MMKTDIEKISEISLSFFNAGITQDALVQRLGNVEKTIPIYDSNSKIASYFVAVTVKEKIAGFMQFDLESRLMRYSTFQRHSGSLEGCPLAKSWLDPNYVLEKARINALPNEDLMTPFLTFDRDITRIVWAVKSKDNRTRTIFVAGEYVYIIND